MHTFYDLSEYAVAAVPDIKKLLLGFELFDPTDYLGVLCGVYLNFHTGNFKDDYDESGRLKLKLFKDSLLNTIHDRLNTSNVRFSNIKERTLFVSNHAISRFTAVCTKNRIYSHVYSSPNGSGIPLHLKLEPTLNTRNFIYKYDLSVPAENNEKRQVIYELVMDTNPIKGRPELRIYAFENNRYSYESLNMLLRDLYLDTEHTQLKSFLKIPELDSEALFKSLSFLHGAGIVTDTFDKTGATYIYALYKGVSVSKEFKNLATSLEMDFQTIKNFIDNQGKLDGLAMELPEL